MTGSPAPLADPAIRIGRVVAEGLAGLGPRRGGQLRQAHPLEMLTDQFGLERRVARRLIRGRIDPRRHEGEGIQQSAAQLAQVGAVDRQGRQIFGQDVEQGRLGGFGRRSRFNRLRISVR